MHTTLFACILLASQGLQAIWGPLCNFLEKTDLMNIAASQGSSPALPLEGIPWFAPAGTWAPPAGQQLNKAGLARLQAEHSSARLVRVANETLK